MARLTAAQRKKLPKSDFLNPNTKGQPEFPVNDLTHIRKAIQLAPTSVKAGNISAKKGASIQARARAMLKKRKKTSSHDQIIDEIAPKKLTFSAADFKEIIEKAKKSAVQAAFAEKAANESKITDAQTAVMLEDYMRKSGLTSAEFCHKLRAWQIQAEWAWGLRDEHQCLSRHKIYELMRKNWATNKSRQKFA